MTELFLPPFGRLAWIDVVLLVWFAVTAVSVAYVAWDGYRNNPVLTVGPSNAAGGRCSGTVRPT